MKRVQVFTKDSEVCEIDDLLVSYKIVGNCLIVKTKSEKNDKDMTEYIFSSNHFTFVRIFNEPI